MLRASLFHLPNKKQEAATEKLFSDLDREKEKTVILLAPRSLAGMAAGGGRGASMRQCSLFSYWGLCFS